MSKSRGAALAGLILILPAVAALAQEGEVWRFVVGGDSRNCGDVVMPAVAAGARAAGASFYWHLGDFRAIYDFDQDLVAARRDASIPLTISDYLRTAWDDFIESQLSPFGSIPVYLAIGNHELVSPKTRADYLIQFADWLDAPPLVRQRLADDPKDHRLKTYYHWIQNGVDFVTLDNASPDQFDAEQIAWFERVVKKDAADPAVRAIVVGMHEVLPDSRAAGHSMSDTVQGEQSGRRVYANLLQAQAAGKRVYLLSSHSHFYMKDLFDTLYWKTHGGVLPGWLIGTTGAIRYPLPAGVTQGESARTNVYGYLVATVAPDRSIRFEFREIRRADVPPETVTRYSAAFVDQCFEGNRQP
jgi:Calcineurin-like phosphoesterase